MALWIWKSRKSVCKVYQETDAVLEYLVQVNKMKHLYDCDFFLPTGFMIMVLRTQKVQGEGGGVIFLNGLIVTLKVNDKPIYIIIVYTLTED